MITDPNLNQPTEVQLRARELADVLVAANAPIPTVPTAEVTTAWKRFGELKKATPSTRHPEYGSGKAFNAANAAIERMQLVKEGGLLVMDMPKVLRRGAKVGVIVADQSDLPPNETGHRHENANFFMPLESEARRYDICVVWVPDSRPRDDPFNVNKYRLGLSHMADSVFHELLHVWFIHAFPTPPGQQPEPGHSGGLDDAQFAKRLKRFQDQLLALDKDLRR